MSQTCLSFLSRLAGLACCSALLITGSLAQEPAARGEVYPARPIQIIVPFAAGGPSDVIARFVGEQLAKELRGTIIVVNKPGAGTNLGMQALAVAKPDGYTIGLATSSLMSNKYMGLAAVDYGRFSPLALMLNSPGAMVVRVDATALSLSDLVKKARAQPNTVTIGNTGAGGIWDLMGSILKDVHQIPITLVPYKGGAPLSVALMSGEVEAGIQSTSGWASYVNAGKLRFLAIATDQRDPVFSKVPTFKEEGIDLVFGFWTGFLAPKGGTPETYAILSEALIRIAKAPVFLEFANKISTNVEIKGPLEFEEFMRADDKRMSVIADKYRSPKR